jgi:hypothetical protein
MGARAEVLRAEIEQTKRDLAEHLAALQEEATASQRRAMRAALVVLGSLVAARVIWFLVKRARRD